MNRRKFIKDNFIGVTSALTGSLLYCKKTKFDPDKEILESLNKTKTARNKVTAGEILQYLRSLGTEWVNSESTVDTFKAGTPDMIVKGIAVGWMSYFEDLKRSVELGCNLFITHEPTYFDHRDNDEKVFGFNVTREKRNFIEKNNLSVIRCHDVWDLMPEIGVRDAWASFLGFENEIQTPKKMEYPRLQEYCRAYEIPAVKAETLAKRIAAKLTAFGEEVVLFVGPKNKIVRSAAIGTGAVTPFFHMIRDLRADIAVCSNDGMRFWRDAALAIDMNFPIIVVDHACSEEFGIRKLAEHVAEKFADVPVYHIPQRCMFSVIRG